MMNMMIPVGSDGNSYKTIPLSNEVARSNNDTAPITIAETLTTQFRPISLRTKSTMNAAISGNRIRNNRSCTRFPSTLNMGIVHY